MSRAPPAEFPTTKGVLDHMDATTMRVLRELVRRHHECLISVGNGNAVSLDFRITDIVELSKLSKHQVEDALETLIDLRVVTRHSLGQFTLTRSALDEFGVVSQAVPVDRR
jgi:hypothetical protein